MHIHQGVVRWAGMVAALSILAEIGWYLLVWRRAYPWRETLATLGILVMRAPLKLLTPLVAAPAAMMLWDHRLWTVPLDTVWGLGLLLLAEEFAYYWMHRSGHTIRWMWASHVVHHTPDHIHLAGAFRLGVTELLSGNWLFYLPLFLLGFSPAAVGAMLAANLFYQFWLHTELVGRLGPLEWVFNTPSHHRIHHASNDVYLDRNYGGVLIIWDRLFGTLAGPRAQTEITYGLVHPLPGHNPLRIAFHEWAAMARDTARAGSWQDRWAALFGRPGTCQPSKPPQIADSVRAGVEARTGVEDHALVLECPGTERLNGSE